MSRIAWFGAAALVCVVATTDVSMAQDALLNDLYGRGVHAFFGRQYAEAHELFTEAIDAGTRDPRCFYFRGLACSRLGRPDEAKADFKQGAEMELVATEQFYNVSQALQRIQGADRMQLEQFRSTARLASYQRDVKRKLQRYEEAQQAEQKVIRKPAGPAADSTAPPAASTPAPENAGDLFAAPKTEKAPEKAAAKPTEGEDPFGEKPAAKPAGEDPFGGDAPAAKPAAKPAGEDPFGAEEAPAKPAAPAAKPAGEDPFGADGGADEKPAAEEKPAAKPAPAPTKPDDEKDPFADEPADGKPEMKKEPAAPGTPPAKPDDDPFGN